MNICVGEEPVCNYYEKGFFWKLDTMYLKDSNVFRHTVTLHRLIIYVCTHRCTDVQWTITHQAFLSTRILQARILEFITE